MMLIDVLMFDKSNLENCLPTANAAVYEVFDTYFQIISAIDDFQVSSEDLVEKHHQMTIIFAKAQVHP